MPILQIERLGKRYGNFSALSDVSFEVPKGSIYGLLGPNGAGKTTLIRIINQILQPDAGRVLLNGKPLVRADVRRIGYLPEERGLYRKMKVGEQAVFLAQLKGLSRRDATRALREWFEKFDIAPWWNKKVEELSKGMAQKVQFIVTVLHRPDLLIFDEPFSGFDPINAQLLKDEILGLAKQGATVLFSTHNMESVEELCDHITLINKARNVLTGEINEVRAKYSGLSYLLGYAGTPSEVSGLLPPGWESEVRDDAEGLHWVALTANDRRLESRALLQSLATDLDIRHFAQEKASMNAIFIRVVRESAPGAEGQLNQSGEPEVEGVRS